MPWATLRHIGYIVVGAKGTRLVPMQHVTTVRVCVASCRMGAVVVVKTLIDATKKDPSRYHALCAHHWLGAHLLRSKVHVVYGNSSKHPSRCTFYYC